MVPRLGVMTEVVITPPPGLVVVTVAGVLAAPGLPRTLGYQ